MADEKASENAAQGSNVTYVDGRDQMLRIVEGARRMILAGEIDGIAVAVTCVGKEKAVERSFAVRNDGDMVRLLGAVVRLQSGIEESFVTDDVEGEEGDEHGT